MPTRKEQECSMERSRSDISALKIAPLMAYMELFPFSGG
jgi:hypothetical protein